MENRALNLDWVKVLERDMESSGDPVPFWALVNLPLSVCHCCESTSCMRVSSASGTPEDWRRQAAVA